MGQKFTERGFTTLPAGVPDGGATNEVLTKLSGTDGDADWAAGGGGGGGSGDPLWTKDVDDDLTALTAITSYSGTWSIDTTLKCVGATSTQCRAFSDVVMSNVAMAIIEVEVEIPSSGFTTSASHIRMGFGPADGVGAVNFGLRGDNLAYFEEDAVLALATNISYTIPAGGTWVTLRMIQNGDRFIGFIDGVQVGEVTFSSLLAGADWSPYVVQYSTGAMTVKYRNLKAWSSNMFDETIVGGSGFPADSWLANLFSRPSDETAHADDEEFNDTIGGTVLTVSGSCTWTQKGHRLSAKYDSVGSADLATRLYPLTPVTFPVTIETRCDILNEHVANPMVGILFADGVTSAANVASMVMWYNTSAPNRKFSGYIGTATNLVASSTASSGASVSNGVYMRLIWTAANTFKVAYSADGISWVTMSIATISKTMTPTHFGPLVTNWGNAAAANASFDYLRITESDLSV